jgi:hypothetical protein
VLLGALLPLILTGCLTTTHTTGTVDSACLSFTYISYSLKNDSKKTVLAVREHNAAYDAVCSGR